MALASLAHRLSASSRIGPSLGLTCVHGVPDSDFDASRRPFLGRNGHPATRRNRSPPPCPPPAQDRSLRAPGARPVVIPPPSAFQGRSAFFVPPPSELTAASFSRICDSFKRLAFIRASAKAVS